MMVATMSAAMAHEPTWIHIGRPRNSPQARLVVESRSGGGGGAAPGGGGG
jgi:hypothetical protein